ncbi:mRNA turnover protein [Acrasis kona]|uniref:Ribosome assembly factor mrt4 n=1 Tax=Acrasis kona TaxID=1008807 RepID=A0AAW2YYC7_9EUKA
MPKSKREKIVSLTKTKKRGTLEHKKELIEEIKEAVEEFSSLILFDLSDSRSTHIRELRTHFNDCRIFMSKNKVMIRALGKSPEDECGENLHIVSSHIVDLCGLLFTNRPKDEIVKALNDFKITDFARSGEKCTETVVIPAGIVPEMPHSLEERLLSLNLPIEVKDGGINFRYEHVVAKKGDTLTPEQAKILKHFSKQLSEFHVNLKCYWSKGDFQDLREN